MHCVAVAATTVTAFARHGIALSADLLFPPLAQPVPTFASSPGAGLTTLLDQLSDQPKDEDPAAGLLAEAERVLGITGPRFTILVGGSLYRLMQLPPEQPAQAAATYAEILYLVRWWLEEHPDVAAELDTYPLPTDDQTKQLPLAVQMAMYLGMSLELYARAHGGHLGPDDAHTDTRES